MIECYQSLNHVACKLPCEKFLLCGHKCQEICGAVECTITCKFKVERELSCKHIAKTYCHLDLSFFECRQEIEKMLPCDHVALVECHQDPETFACREQVEKKLPCEHIAIMACSMDPATYLCLQKMKVEVCEYGHTEEIKCCDKEMKSSVFNETVKLTLHKGCTNICDFKLNCGHGCTRTCRECIVTKNHAKCYQIFNKPFSLCPHKSLCAAPLSPCRDSSSYRCFHRNNTSYACKELYEICLRSCDWNCPHYTCTAVCSQPCNRPPCNHPCRKPLVCGHVCSGLCGEPCLSTCRKCNKRSFVERVWPNVSILSNETRFLELQPCRHFVEVTSMDVWVQESVQQLPGNLDSFCFLRCPVCSEKVNFCPRYNQCIRRHELSLIAAKKLIEASGNLKRTIDEYVTLWLRTKQCDVEMKEKLNQLGVNDRLKLGILCILQEIEVMESQRRNSDIIQKCKASLSNIRQSISEEEEGLYFEDKAKLAADIIMMYKLYIGVQLRRLMTFVRGPNLRVLDKCSKRLDELECIEVTEDNFINIWTKIEKLNRKLSTKLSPQDRRDEITDYVDYLNRFFDVQLDATFLSHWACCRLGHVYSTKEKIDKDQIDASCPQCHPVHNVLLYFLKPEFDETAVMTKIDTAAYYKRNEIAADLSYPKRTDSDCSASGPLAEIVPDGNVGILGRDNNPEMNYSYPKVGAGTNSVRETPEKKIVGDSSFRGGHLGKRGRGGNVSWTQARLNREDSSFRQPVNTTRESQTPYQSRSFKAAQQSVENPRQAFMDKDRWRSDRSSGDNWRTKDSSESGNATGSTFSYMRNSPSVANVQQTRFRGSWRVSNDNKDAENWRAPADRGSAQRSTSKGGRDSPLSWR